MAAASAWSAKRAQQRMLAVLIAGIVWLCGSLSLSLMYNLGMEKENLPTGVRRLSVSLMDLGMEKENLPIGYRC